MRPPSRPTRRMLLPLALAPVLILVAVTMPRPAHASFHLIEVSRVMAGYNGNASIQAVELRMLAAGQNLVSGGAIKSYDAGGNPIATLGTFAANVPNSALGSRILCATSAFQTTFGITADLTITAGVPVGTGQVSFENLGCFVNGIAYGAVGAPRNGSTVAAALPKDLAYALVRTVDDGTILSCPLDEDAAARMTLMSGNAASPVAFRNNAGASVNVASAVTAVEGTVRGSFLGIAPNPVRQGARVTAPGDRRLTIHDPRGRLVRVLSTDGTRAASPYATSWDGRDDRGRPVPSGIYFLRYAGVTEPLTRRFVVVR